MKIAVASGKGGTGKTTVCVNISKILAENGAQVTYADCDVEEPNGHLFLHPEVEKTQKVGVLKPVVDNDLCDGCGKCGEICRYNAIVVIKGKPLTFPELCSGCGGCALVCPHHAITEETQEAGVVETGFADGIRYVGGRIRIGEPRAVPVIREVKHILPDNGYIVLDAPPGTTCPVIETIKGSDVVLLVTEPTPFGLHDLKLASAMVKEVGLPQAVVLNRSGRNNGLIYDFCSSAGVDIIAEIPDDRRIAEAYSRGELIVDALPEYRNLFGGIVNRVTEMAASSNRRVHKGATTL
jgi:MinD superfamily P-loop ATPase